MRRNIEKLLGLAGMINCLFISATFAQMQVSNGESIWQISLLPGLYLLEIASIGILAMISIWKVEQAEQDRWGKILWACAGALLSFVILGAMTTGLFIFAAVIAFWASGLSINRRFEWPRLQRFGLSFLVTIIQSGIIFIPILLA